MYVRRIILLLAAGGVLAVGSSLAQSEGIGLLSDLLVSDITLNSNGQDMTGVDSGGVVALGLDYLGTDSLSLSGQSPSIASLGEVTGEMNSGFQVPDPLPQVFHLILSEVYYDGTDEWIEITNIGAGDFEGNFMLSGVKSTPVSLTGISFLSGESKIFGDNLSQVSGNRFIGKTGLAFSMTDTAQINIYLSISGQIEDSFLVDQYRVEKYNDKKTSFEKMAGIPTPVQSGRVINAQSGTIINPGVYFSTGMNITDVSIPPQQSSTGMQLPISCDSIDQRDLVKIDEIFPGNEKYPPYIELAIHSDIFLNSLSISGDRLMTGLEFSLGSGGTTLEKNSYLLISSTGFRQDEGIPSVRNRDFSLLSTGNYLLITIGSGQNRQVMDIVYVSGNMLGKSSYFTNTSYQCARILDALDEFSPGFEKKFLKYIPVTTVTKIEYIQVFTGNRSEGGNCLGSGTSRTFSGDIQASTDISGVLQQYSIHILDIDYDPPGSDTDNEKITLLATNSSGNQTPLDLGKIFRLKVNGTKKTLPWILPMDVPTTFTKTFGFPNSTDSGVSVVIQLTYGEYIFDTYTYTPQKLSSQEEKDLTTTGYSVSSVVDGDTFRIKYQGKTQSVRLLGVDAPESTKTRYKYLECFGAEAKDYLKSLIDKKKITFQFDPSQDQKDIYDRLLAYVFLDGENINQTMIEDGYAKEYTYKTAYDYQSQFRQSEQSARNQKLGLRNESACGISMSGIQFTGEVETTGAILDLSGVQFFITYVFPNPEGSDKAEELGLLVSSPTPTLPITWRGSNNIISSLRSGEGVGGEATREQLDMSQGFSLRIGKNKKKIDGIVHIGQENILSGSLGLVNKAACVSLFYEEQELTKFCYGKPKEGQKIYASDSGLEETVQENLDILNSLQLKRIGNQLCIRYKEQSFLCKRIPASKAELKTTQEQKLYKGFASLIKQYIINNRKSLYYDTSLKEYFDLVAQDKKLIAQGIVQVDIYGQSVLVTDMKKQLQILQTTLPGIIAVFEGADSL